MSCSKNTNKYFNEQRCEKFCSENAPGAKSLGGNVVGNKCKCELHRSLRANRLYYNFIMILLLKERVLCCVFPPFI